MAEPIRIEEEGYVDIVIGEVEQRIDLWKTNNKIAELQGQHGEDVNGFNESLVNYFMELGFPEMSQRTANSLALRVIQLVENVRKKGSSAATT